MLCIIFTVSNWIAVEKTEAHNCGHCVGRASLRVTFVADTYYMCNKCCKNGWLLKNIVQDHGNIYIAQLCLSMYHALEIMYALDSKIVLSDEESLLLSVTHQEYGILQSRFYEVNKNFTSNT